MFYTKTVYLFNKCKQYKLNYWKIYFILFTIFIEKKLVKKSLLKLVKNCLLIIN